MSDISNTADTLDVRDIIARFEELEGNRKPWRAGWNMPGYMPDSEPAGFETFADARDYIVSELTTLWADASDDDAPGILASRDRWSHIPDHEEAEQGETIGAYHYWIAQVDGADAFESADDAKEYATLKDLLDDLQGNGGDEQWRGDWYPVTLINDDYFVEAMKELCADIGDIPRDLPSYIEIDWEATAKNLRVDYSSTEFDGVTFWYR